MIKKAVFLFAFLAFGFTTFGQSKEVALALFKENKYAEAADLFEKIYKQTPDESNYRLLLFCYRELKQYGDAEKLIKNRQRRNGDVKLIIDEGYYQQLQKKQEEADKSYKKALSQVARNPGLAYPVSEHFSEYGLYNQALEAYTIAESVSPNMAFHYQKGLIYAELGDMPSMINEYLELISQSPNYYENVRLRMARNISNDPDSEVNELLRKQLIKKIQETQNPLFSQLLIWLYSEEEQYDKALRQQIALDKRGQNQESEIYALGEQTLNKEDYAVALDCFDYLVKKGPSQPFYEDALYSKLTAQRLSMRANPESKTADYKNLLNKHYTALPELAGDERYVYLNRDIADLLFFNLNNKDTAVGTLNYVIERFSSNYKKPVAECKMLLGDMLLAQGESMEAIFKYMQVESAFRETPLGDQAKYMKGMVAFYTYDFPWALTQFEALKSSTTKLISNDALQMALLITDNSQEDSLYQGLTYYAKAEFYDFRNLPDSALGTLQDLLDVFPEHAIRPEAQLFKARILNSQTNYKEAISTLEIMLASGGDIWADDALMLLGELYTDRIGDKEKGMLAYEKILFEHPGSTFVPEARRRYRKLRGDDLTP